MSRPERRPVPALVGSEVTMTFRRRRNQVILAVLAAIPVTVAVAVRVGGTGRAAGTEGAVFAGVTSSGVFVAFSSLLVVQSVFLPLAVSVVAGDSVAGEAASGTLRYLLTVPVARTRLLLAKFAAIMVWALACASTVAVAGVLIGLVLFPVGDVTLLSGDRVSFGGALLRLLAVVGYVTAMYAVVGAIGLFVSTLTEVPLAAMAATLVVGIVSQVLDAVPQLHAIGDWLPSHYWGSFTDLLRDPIGSPELDRGVVVALIYVLVFLSAAWARFADKDITS